MKSRQNHHYTWILEVTMNFADTYGHQHKKNTTLKWDYRYFSQDCEMSLVAPSN